MSSNCALGPPFDCDSKPDAPKQRMTQISKCKSAPQPSTLVNPRPSGVMNMKLVKTLETVVGQGGSVQGRSAPKPEPVLSFTWSVLVESPGILSSRSGNPSPLTSMRSVQVRVTE